MAYSVLVVENGGKKISRYLEEKLGKLSHLSLEISSVADEAGMEILLGSKNISLLVIDKGPVGDMLPLLQGKKGGKVRMVFILARERTDFRCCAKEFDSPRVVLVDSSESLKMMFSVVQDALSSGCKCAA